MTQDIKGLKKDIIIEKSQENSDEDSDCSPKK